MKAAIAPYRPAVLFKAATAITSKRQRNFCLKVLQMASETAASVELDDYGIVYALTLHLMLEQDFPVVSQRRGKAWFTAQGVVP